jgi:hypothetical protein
MNEAEQYAKEMAARMRTFWPDGEGGISITEKTLAIYLTNAWLDGGNAAIHSMIKPDKSVAAVAPGVVSA